MTMRALWGVVAIFLVVIIILAWFLFATPAQAPTIESGSLLSTTTAQTGVPVTNEEVVPPPLHERVVVDSPKPDAAVDKTFEVKGEAPGNWYFEASFPIQVRDQEGNVIGRAHGSAQSEWMTVEQVPFVATITIDGEYTGAATLILLRDNPSGLPENDDSLEVPITIK